MAPSQYSLHLQKLKEGKPIGASKPGLKVVLHLEFQEESLSKGGVFSFHL